MDNFNFILDELNEKQRQAVCLPKQSALVLAGAGSGKTKVLTTRIAYLIHSGMAHPSQILTVTFTNKASKEMLGRIQSIFKDTDIKLNQMWIGTFHGLCHKFLRIYHQLADLPESFRILDQDEQLSEVKKIYKMLDYDPAKYLPKVAQKYINKWKEQGIRANRVETRNYAEQIYAQIYQYYEENTQKEGKVDFAELLLKCYELLNQNDDLCHLFRERFQYILVDEFQDTSWIEYQWLRILKSSDNTIFAVGDDDQSIYSFRGANSQHMQSFGYDFNTNTIVRLEQNYRSQSVILEAANSVIEFNSNRLGKNLWTNVKGNELIRQYQGFSDRDESYFVAQEIRELIKNGANPNQIAILYRTNAQSRLFEQSLTTTNIPFQVYGSFRFYQRLEIKQALAYLYLLIDPNDDDALLRVINFPPRGIGEKSIEKLQDEATTLKSSLFNACLQSINPKVKQFTTWINQLRDECYQLSLVELVEFVLDKTGLIKEYETKKDEARVENLKELVNACQAFSIEHGTQSLSEFLSMAILEGSTYTNDEDSENPQAKVQLMTIHYAKGLEFDIVFVVGLEENLFPSGMSNGENLEEERRLMYVAITRAKQQLYFTHADCRMINGTMMNSKMSRFIREIPERLIKKILIKPSESHVFKQVQSLKEKKSSLGQAKHQANTVDDAKSIVNKILTASTEQSQSNLNRLSVGQKVEHHTFGQGFITQLSSDRVVVNFFKVGSKSLMLEKAKLKPLS